MSPRSEITSRLLNCRSSHSLPHSAYRLSRLSSRCLSTNTASVNRVPSPTPFVPDVSTFLKLIGRDCKQFESKIASWETLFASSSKQLRALGVEPPRTRRYILNWREKFRRGDYGVWGGLTHVDNGIAELRVADKGGKKVILNTLPSTSTGDAVESTTESVEHAGGLRPTASAGAEATREAKVVFPDVVSGPRCLHVKGTRGTVARVQVEEGLWEHKRGYKVAGGERLVRRAKTLVARRRRGVGSA